MAGKIPVGATVARAYGFAFGNIANNLGMIWIPVALLWAASYFLQRPYLDATLGAVGPQATLAAMPLIFGYFVISFVLLSAQIAALTKEALGLRTGNAFLQFPFGAGAWRLLAAFFLYFVVMVIVYVAILFGSLLLTGLAVAISGGRSAGAAMAVGFVAFGFMVFIIGALLYIATRLSFFLAPVAVAERKVSLIRAWQLTKGNFWRIFLVLLVLFVPFLVLESIFLVKVLGPSFQSLHVNMTPQELAAWQQRLAGAATAFSRRWWFVTYPVGAAVALILYGLYAGASAYAYRAVTHEDSSPDVF